MNSTSRPSAPLLLAVALLLIAGCGSTALESARGTLGNSADPEFGAPGGGSVVAGSGASTPEDAIASNDGDDASAGISADGSNRDVAGASSGSSSTAPRRPAVPALPGVTDTTLELGYVYIADAASRAAALGQVGVQPATQTIVEALVEWVNRTGGLAGRRVKAVGHGWFTGVGTYAQQDQEACTSLAEDERVYVALARGSFTDTMSSCFANHRTLGLTAPLAASVGARTFRKNPLYFESVGTNLDRLAPLLADGLHQQGYYTSAPGAPPRIGLVRADTPDFDDATARYRERLGRHRLAIAEECAIVPSQSSGDTSRVVAELSSCVLRLRTAGISHVVFLLPDAGGAQFFLREAQNQGAEFRYGMSTNDAPQKQREQPDAQPGQFRDAAFVGWSPTTDVAEDAQQPVSDALRRCRAILRAAGVSPTSADSTEAALWCDNVFFLRAVLGTKWIPIRADTFGARVAALTGGFPTAFTFATRFGPARRWGTELWRGGTYREDCGCFRYVGDPRPFPS